MEVTREPDPADLEMQHACHGLQQLEHGEWWRWITSLLIMLALAIGFFFLRPPAAANQPERIQGAELGLLCFVILFGLFVIYRKILAGHMRRALTVQIATAATLEALRPLSREEQVGQAAQRQWTRYPVDEPLTLLANSGNKEKRLQGRLLDISERGVGAVVPDSLNPGEAVVLQFNLPGKLGFVIPAVVRHRRGYRYGFDFVDLPETTVEKLQEALGTLGTLSALAVKS